jgi:DNA-binding NarL/FixJ family response regulator
MKNKIKIVLVEDNPEYRYVIKFALEDDPEVALIDHFGTAEQALRSLQNMATRNVPDVVLLDLNLPGISGLEALPEFAKTIPDSRIIILTQSENEADVLNAIEQGAAGYLLKSSSVQQIKAGIKMVTEGGASLDPRMAQFVLNTLQKRKTPIKEPSVLSERETGILTLVSQGVARKEIGNILKISTKTVDNHIAHIFEKLNVVNSPAAVAEAYKTGLFILGD